MKRVLKGTTMYRIRMMVTALLLAAAGAGAADAQESGFARARAALTGNAGVRFEETVRNARANGLPTEPLIAKALEGVAKGVPADRVAVAVRQLAVSLGHANALLRIDGRAAAAADIEATADALQRGLPENAVRSLRADARPDESIALSVHALADLHQRGVPVAVGLDVIGAWRGRGADPQRLAEIPAAVERLVRQGVLPAQAGAAVAGGLRAGRGLGTLNAPDVAGKIGGAAKGRKKN